MSPKRSKFDTASVVVLIVGVTCFAISAISYLISIFFITFGGSPGLLTTTDLGNLAGIVGMIIIPLYIIMAVIQTFREKRQTRDDNPEQGTTEDR